MRASLRFPIPECSGKGSGPKVPKVVACELMTPCREKRWKFCCWMGTDSLQPHFGGSWGSKLPLSLDTLTPCIGTGKTWREELNTVCTITISVCSLSTSSFFRSMNWNADVAWLWSPLEFPCLVVQLIELEDVQITIHICRRVLSRLRHGMIERL